MAERQDDNRSSTRRRAEAHGGGFTRTSVLLPDGHTAFSLDAEGVKRIDICNYRVGDGNPWADPGKSHPERTFFVHRNVGPNEDSYICLAKTFNEPCPICEFKKRMEKGSKLSVDELKDLNPKERQLFWVMDHSDLEKGWQLWDISFHLFGKLLDKRIKLADQDEPWDMYGSPTRGFTLKLGITEKSMGRGNPFYEVASIDFKARETPYPKTLIDELPCLDSLIVKTPYEKLKAIFLQTPDDAREDPPARGKPPVADDEPAAPKPKPKPAPVEDDEPAPPAKPKPKPAPVQDDDDPPPRPKPKPAPVADDDDPPPRPKSKPAPVADDDDPPPKPKPKPAPVTDDDDPPPKPAKPAAKAPKDDDNWDDWEGPAKPAAKKPPRPADDE